MAEELSIQRHDCLRYFIGDVRDLSRLTRAMKGIDVVIEGGAGTLSHLDLAFAHGVEALGIGTMLTFSDNNIFKIKEFLASRGHAVRRIGKG